MAEEPLVKGAVVTAAEICARFSLKKEALALLRNGVEPREFAEALVTAKQYLTGIDFMAHAMPARQAVLWGCLCLQHACRESLSPADKAACRAAVQWVMQPSEENRVAAWTPTHAAGPGSPAAGLAMAVYQTGGNIAPAGALTAAPPNSAPAKAIAGAVKMACAKADPIKIVETQRLLVELAIGMAISHCW